MAETPTRNPSVFKGGWYLWDPYQYIPMGQTSESLTGLDVQLTRNIFNRIHEKMHYEPVSWHQHLSDIKDGLRDVKGRFFLKMVLSRKRLNNDSLPYILRILRCFRIYKI